MMNIDKIKYLLKDKIHQMFICLMISLMLLSNFPAYIINAEDGDGTNVSNSPVVLTLSKDVKSLDGDKYTFTVNGDEKLADSSFNLVERNSDFDNYSLYDSQIRNLFKNKDVKFTIYTLSVTNSDQQQITINEGLNVNIQKDNKDSTDYGDTVVVSLNDPAQIVSNNTITLGSNNTLNIALVNEINDYVIDSRAVYSAENEYQKNSQLKIDKIKEDDDKYIKDDGNDIDDYSVEYLKQYELTVHDQTIPEDVELAQNRISVSLTLSEKKNDLDLDDLGIVVYGSNNEKTLIKPEENEESKDEKLTVLSFEVDGPCIFSLVKATKNEPVQQETKEPIQTESIDENVQSEGTEEQENEPENNDITITSETVSTISATFSAETEIPADAVLVVEEIAISDENEKYLAIKDKLENLNIFKIYDISIMKDGVKVQPKENTSVKVSIELDSINAYTSMHVYHVGEAAVEITNNVVDNSVNFSVSGFSIFALSKETTAFNWGEYSYNISDDLTLGELFNILEITEVAVSDVEQVSFEDAESLTVEAQETDWLLKPVNTFEDKALTLTLKNEQVVTITLKNKHNPKVSISASDYNQENATITYTVTVQAEGSINNQIKVNDLTTAEGSGLEFVSGTADDESFTFPYFIPQMADGDTITLSYTVKVNDITFDDDRKVAQVINTVTITNEGNRWDDPSDDSASVTKEFNYAPLEKEMSDLEGNWATYKITINPNGYSLNNGEPLTLKDTFSGNQSIDYASIHTSDDVSYDYRSRTGTFVIPDRKTITIIYRARIVATPGAEVDFDNTSELYNSSQKLIASAKVQEHHTIYPSASDVASTTGDYMVKMYVYGDAQMQTGIPDAQFILMDETRRPLKYRKGDNAGEDIVFTTDATGYANIQLDEEEGDVTIEKNTAYYLEMIKAPSGYKKDTTLYSFMITDDPGYESGGIWTYYNGDTMKVRLYPEETSVNASLRFSGNYELDASQKNTFSVILQKKVGDTWEEVERRSYPEFTNGSITFDAGRSGSNLELERTYRVIQDYDKWVIPQDISVSTTYYLSIGSNVAENSHDPLEFTVSEENVDSSFNFVINNEFIIHKLSITKMDKETGVKLAGAVFTVKKASNNAAVTTYTTDNTGLIEISGGSAGFESNTLYYVVETTAPQGYLLPVEENRIYFYFCNDEDLLPSILADLPEGETATDLLKTFDSISLDNQKETHNIPVMKIWQGNSWPQEADRVEIGLYKTVGSVTEQVKDAQDQPLTVWLTKNKPYDDTAFKNLPTRENGQQIKYSIKEERILNANNVDIIGNYVQEYGVSDSGVYIVKNKPATVLTVNKQWFDSTGTQITDAETLANQPTVAIDIYRSSTKISDEILEGGITNEELESLLSTLERVRSKVRFGSADNWTLSINDIPKDNDLGNRYYYYVHETVPSFGDEIYEISNNDNTITIKNNVAPNTVDVVVEKKIKDDPRPSASQTDFEFTLRLYKGSHPIREFEVGEGLVTDWDGEATFTLKHGNTRTLNLPVGVNAEITEAVNNEYFEVATCEGLEDINTDDRIFEFTVDSESAGKTILYTNTLRVVCKVEDNQGVEHAYESFKSLLEYVRSNPSKFDSPIKIEMLEDYIMPENDVFDVREGEEIILTTAATSGTDLPFHTDRTDYPYTGLISRGDKALSLLVNQGTLKLENIILDGSNNKVTTDGGLINNSGTLNIEEDTILRNSVVNGRGGAIYSTGTVNMSAGIIEKNKATNGSAIYLSNSTLNMAGGTIRNNVSSNDGAIAVDNISCKINLSHSPVIFDNYNDGNAWANIYLGVDSDNVINIVNPGLDSEAKIGVKGITGHRDIGDQFATAALGYTDNLNCFVNDDYEYRGRLKDGTSTNIVWDGLTLSLKKVFAGKGGDENDRFNITISSTSIKKTTYTISGIYDYTCVAARPNTPGRIILRNVYRGQEITIYPLPVGTYTIEEDTTNYSVSFEGTNEESGESFDFDSGTFLLQGNSKVDVINTRKLTKLNLTKTLEDKLKTADETQEFDFSIRLEDSGETPIKNYDLGDGLITDQFGMASFDMSPTSRNSIKKILDIPVGAKVVINEAENDDYRVSISATTNQGDEITDEDSANSNIFIYHATEDEANITFDNMRKMQDIVLCADVVGKVSKEETFTYTVTLTRKDGLPATNYTLYEDETDVTKNITTDTEGVAVIPFTFGENEISKSVTLTVPDGTKLRVVQSPIKKDVDGREVDIYNTTHSLNGGSAISGLEVNINPVSEDDRSIVFNNTRKTQTITVSNTVNGYSGNTIPFTFVATVTDGNADDYDMSGFVDGSITFELATGQSRVLTVPYGATFNIEEEFIVGYETKIKRGDSAEVVATKADFVITGNETLRFTNNQLIKIVLVNNTSASLENVQVYTAYGSIMYRVNETGDGQDSVPMTNHWATVSVESGKSAVLAVNHQNSVTDEQAYTVKGVMPSSGYYYIINNEPSYHEFADPAVLKVYNNSPYEVKGKLRYSTSDATVTFNEQILVDYDANGGVWTNEMDGYHEKEGSNRGVYQYALTSGQTAPVPAVPPVYPTSESIVFLGWTADETYAKATHTEDVIDPEKAYDFNTPVIRPITLYAVWKLDRTDRVVTVKNATNDSLTINVNILQNGSSIEGYPTNITIDAGNNSNLSVPNNARLELKQSNNNAFAVSSEFTNGSTVATDFTIADVDRDGTVSFINGICKITDASGNILYESNERPAVYRTLDAAFTAYSQDLYNENNTLTTPAAIKMLVDEYTLQKKNNKNYLALTFPANSITLTTAGKDDSSFPYIGNRDRSTIYRFNNDKASYSCFEINDINSNVTLTNIILDGGSEFGRKAEKSTNGAIVNLTNGVLNVEEGTIIRNSEFKGYDDGNNGRGGAIHATGSNSTLKVEAGIFSNLHARRGGAIDAESNANVNISGTNGSTRFENCDAMYDDGGAIRFSSDSIGLTINGGTDRNKPGIIFNSCVAYSENGDGGAIYAFTSYNDPVFISGIEFVECSSKNTKGDSTQGYGGGAINAYHVKGLTVSNCIFNACDTMKCGGAVTAYVKTDTSDTLDEADISFANCLFEKCNCKGQGGAIAVYQDNNGASTSKTKIAVEDSKFNNCSSGTDNGSGGAIQCYLPCVEFNKVYFIDCWAGKEGGAVNNYYGANPSQMWANSYFRVIDSRFIRCRAEDRYDLGGIVHYGGGISTKTVTMLVSESYFEDCVSTLKQGGAVHCLGIGSGSTSTIENSTFKNCMAKDNGGAFMASSETMTVTNSYFYGCSSFAQNGGALYHGNNSRNSSIQEETIISNCYFKAENDSSVSCSAAKNGGAIWTRANTVAIQNCTIDKCEASGNGGAVYLNKDNGYVNKIISGGTITNCKAVNGSAVYTEDKAVFSGANITANTCSNINSGAIHGGTLYFEGNVRVEKNPCSNDDSYMHDVLMQNNNASTINTTSNKLGENAYIGVYVPDSQFNNRGIEGKDFGTRAVAGDLLDSFFNDRDDGLFGYQGTGSNIVWGRYLCKITDATGNTLKRPNGRPAVFQSITSAFDNFTSVSGGTPVYVKMLIEKYTVFQKEVISNFPDRDITLTTAGKNDSMYPYRGAEGTVCTISRTNSNNQLFKLNNSNATFRLENITLDGRKDKTSTTGNYRLIEVNDGSLIINGGTTLKYGYSSSDSGGAIKVTNQNERFEIHSSENGDVIFDHCTTADNSGGGGGAIWSNRNITIDSDGTGQTIFAECHGVRGGAIMLNSSMNATIARAEFRDCYALKEGGAFYHNNNNSNAETSITNSKFINCYTNNDERWSYGGAINCKAGTLKVISSEFENCYSKSNGGAINHGSENSNREKTLLEGNAFVNCKTTGTHNSYGYGGSVYTQAKSVEIKDCNVLNSESYNHGGALYCQSNAGNSNTVISGSTFENCTVKRTDGRGGAICSRNKSLTLQNSEKNFTSINSCTSPKYSGAVHMEVDDNGSNRDLVLNVVGDTLISGCYASEGGAIYLNNGVTMNVSGSPEFSKNGYTSAGESSTKGACIYLVQGSTINLSGSPRFSRNNIINQERIINGGMTDYIRQDLYLAGYKNVNAASIKITGELTGDVIWVWPEEIPHKKDGEQFANISAEGSLSLNTFEKLRNALPDSATGCTDGEFLAGVKLENDAANVYWNKMYNISFRKLDNKGVSVPEAKFTLYADNTFDDVIATALSADGITDTSVYGEILPKGTVDYTTIPMGTYFMKEDAPDSFLPNDTVYIVLVGSVYLARTERYHDLWDNGALDVPNATELIRKSTIQAGKYYGIYPIGDNGKADLSKNLALSNVGVVNIRNDYQAWFMKVDDSGLPLPNAGFTIYAQELDNRGNPKSYDNGYPMLTLWSRDGENYPDPVKSADGTDAYKKIDGSIVPKGMVYFRELPAGTFFLLETIYPERNGNNRRTSYVKDDHVLKLVVSGESFTLSKWSEEGGGTYNEVDKDDDGYYVVVNKEAACKLTDGNNNLLYEYGFDDETLLPAVYPTLEEGFAAAQTHTLQSYSGSDIASNAALKLKALKDFTIDEPITYNNAHQLTFTTAETTARENDRYVFFTNRTSDVSRAEIKRNYSEDTSADANAGALFTVGGSSSMIMQNINLNGQKNTFTGRAVHVTDGSTLTVLDNAQFTNFKVVASETSVDTNDVRGGAILMDESTILNIDGGATYRSATFSNNEVVNNRTSGSTGADGGAVAIGKDCQVNIVNAQFTNNKVAAKVTGEGNGGAVALNAVNDDSTKTNMTLRNAVFRNNTSSNDGGAVYASEDTTVSADNSTFQSNRANGNGGAIALSSSEEHKSELVVNGGSYASNSSTGNGGALYVDTYGKLTLRGNPAISSNTAVEGAALYGKDCSNLYIAGGNISRNSASGVDGGAINVETANVRIYFSGSPTIFNNTKNNNQRNVVLNFDSNEIIRTYTEGLRKNAKIGIYVVDGENKNIYNEHGVLKKPFGTFSNADYLEVFVNDRNLSLFGARNDEEEADVLIYWQSKGAPIAFKKIDSYGDALAGATFTLYTDRNCTQPLDKGDGEKAISVSANGTSTRNENGDLLAKGTVLFESIPENYYYMKETGRPSGFVDNNNVYVVLVGAEKLVRPANVSGTIWASNGVLANITQGNVNDQRNRYNSEKSYYKLVDDTQYAIFLIDSATGKAVTDPSIARYGVMNTSDKNNLTILKKIDNLLNPLPGAKFEIFRYDRTLVSSKDIYSNVTTTFTSGSNGAYFIDNLPYGTYYLHETLTPSSVQQTSGGWWYTLTINETGAHCSEKSATAP